MIFNNNDLDTYWIVCKNYTQLDFWMKQFAVHFANEIVFADCNYKRCIKFKDSIYYFTTSDPRNLQGRIKPSDTTYPQEAIYIILDDPERERIESYEGV